MEAFRKNTIIDDEKAYRLVGDGELAQVVSNHLWLHLNLGVREKVVVNLLPTIESLDSRLKMSSLSVYVPFLL